ncbi:MAG: hypothetical protein AAF597_02840 [Bacteroidota bacterium]
MSVAVERTSEAILIKLPLDTSPKDIQHVLDYFEYVKLVNQSQATEDDISALAKEAKSGWWQSNQERFRGVKGMEHLFNEEE